MSVSAQRHFADINFCKRRMNLGKDAGLDDIFEMTATEVDRFIIDAMKHHIGTVNSSGNPIIHPLTKTSSPPLSPTINTRANDLLIAKYRKEQTGRDNDIAIWEAEKKDFVENTLFTIYGWPEGHAFRVDPTITINPINGPVGSTIAITGVNFRGNAIIFVFVDGSPVALTPTTTLTDVNGNFSTQITLPPTALAGQHVIKVLDGDGSALQADNTPFPVNGAIVYFIAI